MGIHRAKHFTMEVLVQFFLFVFFKPISMALPYCLTKSDLEKIDDFLQPMRATHV